MLWKYLHASEPLAIFFFNMYIIVGKNIQISRAIFEFSETNEQFMNFIYKKKKTIRTNILNKHR